MSWDVWGRHARQWTRVGPPLRPSDQDIAFYTRAIEEAGAAPRVLVLGVTPELARLPWPEQTALTAIDRAPAMIREVWPGYPTAGEGALCADWTTMSLPRGARDLVISDGCFGVLPFAQYPLLLRSLEKACTPDYRLVFRLFVRPEAAESPRTVLDDALAGRIESFHAFKLRYLMAHQESTARGVSVAEVWTSWSREGLTPEDVEAAVGWPADQVRTIDVYRDQELVYTFPSPAELDHVLVEAGLAQVRKQVPTYPLGERCPSFVYQRKKA